MAGLMTGTSSVDVRATAKRLLSTVPPLITNIASDASRGHRIEVGMRTVAYESGLPGYRATGLPGYRGRFLRGVSRGLEQPVHLPAVSRPSVVALPHLLLRLREALQGPHAFSVRSPLPAGHQSTKSGDHPGVMDGALPATSGHVDPFG